MNDIVLTFTLNAVLWGIFILLLLHVRKKGIAFAKKEKGALYLAIFVLIAVSGWIYFFDDAGFIFSCRKSTRRCDYSHSTLFDKRMRFVRSYDLTGITAAEVVSRKRNCGRYCLKTVYRVRLHGNGTGFEIPKDIVFEEDAQQLALKAADFIQTDKPAYEYKDIMSNDSGKKLILIMGSVFSMAFAFAGIQILLAKLFRKAP